MVQTEQVKGLFRHFLTFIGGILVAESLLDCYNTTVDEHQHIELNKNYAYIALAFAMMIELFNMKERRIKRARDFNQEV